MICHAIDHPETTVTDAVRFESKAGEMNYHILIRWKCQQTVLVDTLGVRNTKTAGKIATSAKCVYSTIFNSSVGLTVFEALLRPNFNFYLLCSQDENHNYQSDLQF